MKQIEHWEAMPYKDGELKRDFPQVTNLTNTDGIVMTCEGKNPIDKENIGPISYFPSQLINRNYFPYTNQPGYLPPFVMVHFTQPTRNVLINVECKAWAKNIHHDNDREGILNFELMIE